MPFIRRFTGRILAAVCVVTAVVASFFALTGSVSFAQTGAAPVITSGPIVSSLADDSAVIRWTTDVESTTVVDFGTTDSLGQSYRKIVPIEETEVTEITHTMTLSPLLPGTKYYYRVSSSTSGGKTSSDTTTLTTPGSACGPDSWTCGDWNACGKNADGSFGQTRTCTVAPSCADAGVPKPATSQSCTPTCTEDTWTCADWQACAASGTQTRTCTMITDCPNATTPKPATSQSCKRPCTADDWKCGDWGSCDKDSQKRSCTLSTACEGGTAPKPDVTQKCTTPEPPKLPACTDKDWTCGEWSACPTDGFAGTSKRNCAVGEQCDQGGNGQEGRTKAETRDCPPAKVESEQKAEPETPPAPDVNAPVPPETPPSPPSPPSPPLAPGAVLGSGDAAAVLQAECAANGISAEGCVSWLAAKYGDHTCAQNGIFSKEACGDFLRKSNGGTMPGCEGKTEAECQAITDRMLAGYMPEDMRSEVDAMIASMKAGDMFGALGDSAPTVLAVRGSHKGDVIWWPSKRADGQDTSPGMFVLDSDKDRLPDDVERRIGTDPKTPDAKVARAILKSYLERGDKPTEAQRTSREKLDKFFLDGEIPSQDDARAVLEAFFGPGTTPPENLTAIDAAFILGMSVGQPMGAGTTDDSFTVDATNMPAAIGGGITLHGHAKAGEVVFLYIYSYVPMVLTTTADADGNYQYDLSDNVVDGSHTAYVALVDGAGDVAAKSKPQSFFVKTALAVTESDFIATDAKLTPTTPTSKATSSYLYGAVALVFGALIAGAFVMRGAGKRKGSPPPVPPAPPTK